MDSVAGNTTEISARLANCRAGDHITFGSYPQKKGGRPEPIEWLVLNVHEGKAIIVSAFGLDVIPYNEVRSNVAWKDSTLRQWLNVEFYRLAFSENERLFISSSHLRNHLDIRGEDTDDRVFLPSLIEAEKLLRKPEIRRTMPTKYAVANGAKVESYHGTSMAWLRSPGKTEGTGTFIDYDGSINEGGINVANIKAVIRPMMLITLKPAAAPADYICGLPMSALPIIGQEGANKDAKGKGDEADEASVADDSGEISEDEFTEEDDRPDAGSELAASLKEKAASIKDSIAGAARKANLDKLKPELTPEQKKKTILVSVLVIAVVAAIFGAMAFLKSKNPSAVTIRRSVSNSVNRDKPLEEQLKNGSIGESVFFGKYAHEGSKPELIEWVVLDRDENYLFVTSRNNIDAMPYNNGRRAVTWEESDICKWLNGTFYETCFSEKEKQAIMTQPIAVSQDDAGDNAEGADKEGGKSGAAVMQQASQPIFLLSKEEAGFLKDAGASKPKPAECALKAENAPIEDVPIDKWSSMDDKAKIRESATAFWLRDAGSNGALAAFCFNGEVNEAGCPVAAPLGLRPALRLSLNPQANRRHSASVRHTARPEPGTVMKFGGFVQHEGTPESLEWNVISADDESALLVCKYGIDSRAFDGTSWDKSGLRAWLNGDFFETAFTEDEQKQIAITYNSDSGDSEGTLGSTDTMDRVFLLSVSEFPANEGGLIPTAYAEKRGAKLNSQGMGRQWLRSRSANGIFAADESGNVSAIDPSDASVLVRPAIRLLFSVSGIKEASQIADMFAGRRPGEFVKFGRCLQKRGKVFEPIEWRILENNGRTALLISRFALNSLPYDKTGRDVSWEESSLRNFLNSDFYESSFSDEEKSVIADSVIDNSDLAGWSPKAGGKTKDKVFLLSASEAAKFMTDERRASSPTDFAEDQGMFFTERAGIAGYWLRSHGKDPGCAAYVAEDASVNADGCHQFFMGLGVRPVIQLCFEGACELKAASLNTVSKQFAAQPKPNDIALRASIPDLPGMPAKKKHGSKEPEFRTIEDGAPGDLVKFGQYPLTADGGKAPLEWIVLDRNGLSVMLISRYVIDVKSYNDAPGSTDWKTCSLRAWLNGDFLKTAFTEKEAAEIVYQDPDTGYAAQNDSVQDKVFILSPEQLKRLMPDPALSRVLPTAYAHSRGAAIDDRGCCHWLRAEGRNAAFACFVDGRGSVSNKGLPAALDNVTIDYCGIRPVIWIEL